MPLKLNLKLGTKSGLHNLTMGGLSKPLLGLIAFLQACSRRHSALGSSDGRLCFCCLGSSKSSALKR